jgi:uncharacterized iron-regulated protein
MPRKPIVWLLPILSVTLLIGACNASNVQKGISGNLQSGKDMSEGSMGSKVLDLRSPATLDRIIPELSESRVIYVGEAHDAYGHHLNQLEIIRRLYAADPDMAIGMEFFQQPFQGVLDDYIAGTLDEREMLARSEWYERWQYDYRLYRPILEFARHNRIPLIALNLPREITERASAVGITGLNEKEGSMIPSEIDRSDLAYRERLRKVFSQHPHSESGDFDRFEDVQLLWDEGMAERAAGYLKANPRKRMVVLAGSGHLMFGSGIPSRVHRRLPEHFSILLPADNIPVRPGVADFVVFPEPAELPRRGMMGVFLIPAEKGMQIDKMVSDGAAEKAGLKKNDLIEKLDGVSVQSMSDIRIALLDKSPGDHVKVSVLRKRLVAQDQRIEVQLELGE